MGKKTNSERLREYIGNRNSEEKKSSVSTQQNSDYIRNLNYQRTINFDTLNTDLTTMGKTLTDIQNGWQTPETMKNTLSSVQSMYNRLGKYQEYQQKYGGADLSELHTAYKSVLDGWEELSTAYSGFKNAESFDKAKKTYELEQEFRVPTEDGKSFRGLTYDEVQAEKKKYKYNTDEFQFLHNYTGYTDLADFDKALKSATSKEMIDSLETARNKHKLDFAFDAYKPLMQNEDFAEKSKYVSTKGDFDGLWDRLFNDTYGMGYKDLTYEYINNVDGMREKIESEANTYARNSPRVNAIDTTPMMERHGYHKLNPDEIATYNYIYSTQGEKEAQKFLDDMEMTLSKRVYDEKTQTWQDNAEGFWGGTIGSIASIPASVFGSIPTAISSISDAIQGKEYNPYSYYKTATNYAQDTRQYVGENIEEATKGFEVAGMNLASFGYSTGLSIADNLVGAATLRQAYLPLMGTNAFHQKAKEMTEAGEDQTTIYKTALASGAAEMVFEKLSLDHFLKIKDVDSIGKIVYNTLTQAGVEASEELFTELTNIISDSVIRGENSDLVKLHKDLITRGYTEKEADIEVAKHIGSQVGWASFGGFLSGGGMGFVGATSNYKGNSTTGKLLQDNGQAQAIFDIANTSEMETAYEAYNQYIGKGATAETISNAKLGNLYNKARGDVAKTLKSDMVSDGQRSTALANALKLGEISKAVTTGIKNKETQKSLEKSAKKNFNIDKNSGESVITETGKAISFKDIKVADGKISVTTENGDTSIDNVTLTMEDSLFVEMASQIANEHGENLANTFLHNYDGETSLDEYSNSFNLAIAYAKNDFSYKTMFDNKGSLSAEMVSDIYQEVKVKAEQEQAQKIAELNQKMADANFYKGFVNDSVIDYENTSAEGKVNWNDLTEQQRMSITFVKGFVQATGMNLILTHNPKSSKGGAYKVKSNTIVLDVAQWTDADTKMLKETIIPTMSHETTHWMKSKSPELWSALNNVVFSTLVDHYNNNTEDKIDFLNKKYGAKFSESDVKDMQITEEDLVKYEAKSSKKSEEVAREEIIARACEDMLSMSKQGRKIFDSLSIKEQNTLVGKIKEIIKNLMDWVDELLGVYKSESKEAQILREYKDALNEAVGIWDEMLEQSIVTNQSLENSGAYGHAVETIGSRDLSEFSEAVDENGEELLQYRAVVEDEDAYREMLQKHKDTIGITDEQITDLFDMIGEAVDIISENLEALDYAWDEDIDNRAFHPVKANSDTLYEVSLDFSTLCRKRLLQQNIQAILQEALKKPLSTEESIAIRDELMKIQEEGKKIEIACALCYVESARMKSPKQIEKFLKNREKAIKEFFAGRSGGDIKEKIKNAEAKARKTLAKKYPDGMPGKNNATLNPLESPLKSMLKADAEFVREAKKKAKLSYVLTEHEQSELDAALKMDISNFTSAKGLENLAKEHSDIFDAYTSYIRNATRSKGLENDVWWRAGDSEAIGDALIAKMNAENGLRSQSWSDFQVIHLLDYVAATIELSTKGAKRQSYTKVPDYVKLLGNTGDMINMSVIPERAFKGKLGYDDVEGMAYKVACELRERYHATAGIICIGISNEQIRLLLDDITIDMVIPYHKSSMSKARRKLMHIPAWKDFEAYQNEDKKLSESEAKKRAKEYGVKLKKDSNYQKPPKFSEWFNLEEARQIAKMENANPSDAKAYKKYGVMYGGYMAMQNAANNYLKLCAERGLLPKFAHPDADFSKDANYWKLLIDRKMVDNVTGEIIEQKAIKPVFNKNSVLEILNDELARYPQVKADQEYATRKVTKKFLSGEMKVDKSTLEAIKKPIDNVAVLNILESSRGEELNSERNNADTFYSHMGKTIDEMKQDKIGANSVVSYLKGRGVKDEEIKWSGIESFLEGKKSVTKAELQEFVAESMLQIEEQELGETIKYTDEQKARLDSIEADTHKMWDEAHSLWGKLFPEEDIYDLILTYNNTYYLAQKIGKMLEKKNLLNSTDGSRLHQLVQDINTMEIMVDDIVKSAKANGQTVKWSEYKLESGSNYREITFKMPNSTYSNSAMRTHWGDDARGILVHARIQDFDTKHGKMLFIEEIQSDWHNEGHKAGYSSGTKKDERINQARKLYHELEEHTLDIESYSELFDEFEQLKFELAIEGIDILDFVNADTVPDAPFRNNYHEYVLKRLIRMAAEQGYDSIGWTPSEIQSERWSDEFAEAYRIEYDQEIPKFLNKYGKKWGAKVGKTEINGIDGGWYEVDGTTIWTMPITDSMKNSVLYEGQTLYSTRNTESYTLTEEEYKQNCKELVEMDFVSHLIGTELDGETPLKQRVSDLFESWGNSIDTKKFGSIALTPSSINSDFRHGTTRNKLTAYAAIPSVLKNGVVIDVFKKNKGEVDRIVIAAPITISNAPFFMGVMIQRSARTNRLYLHDVVIKKEASEYQTEHLITTGMFESENLFVTEVLEKAVAVGYSLSLQREKVKDLFSTRNTGEGITESVYEIMGESDRLLRENKQFRAEVERLRERLAIEKKVTGGTKFNENQLGAVAGHLRKISGSNIDKVELMKALKEVYTHIVTAENLAWDDVYEKCYSVAQALVKESKPITVENSYYRDWLEEIRKTRISFDETQKKEAAYLFDKYWNRAFLGKIIIADDGINIESKWREWSGMDADLFKPDVGNNHVSELYTVIESLRESLEVVDKKAVLEQTRWLAEEVYNGYWNISPIRTTADKYDKQIKRLNFEHRQRMSAYREDYERRLAEQGLADDIYYGRKLGEQKTKYEAKLEQKKARIEKQRELYKKLRDRKNEEIAIAKAQGREKLTSYKENAERKTRIQRITANALTLNKWMKTNSKDYHIHEAMKGPVIKLLNAIDFSSRQRLDSGIPTEQDISFAEAFSEIKSMLEKADNMVEGLEELYGHDLAETIELMSKAAFNRVGDNHFIINNMSNEELYHLDKLVRDLKKTVVGLNKFHTIQMGKGAVESAHEFIEYGEKIGNLKKQHGDIGKFFKFRNLTPYYFFKKLGPVGEKLFKAFQDGWDKLAYNAKQIIDFTESVYTAKEVKQWSKETVTFNLPKADGNERTFEMSVSQIMALYCVSKQQDAKNHLFQGGMTLKRVDNKGNVITDYENIPLTPDVLTTIISKLSDRQIEVADKLQEFMNTVCSEWGNEISMARFGVKMFGIPDYFPIKVSEATVPTDNTKDMDNASLFRLLNMSFTKARKLNAKQSIEIGDIFDIFAQHSSDMAKYNAMALPVLDFNKFYSIHGADGNNNEYGVVQTLKKVFGDEANGYLRRFVRDLNSSQNVSRDVLGNKFFKNAKLVSVANNIRVILLQPTAFHKAGAVMDNKYLLKASSYIKLEPIGMVKKLKKAIAEAEKYCGIIQWKSLGYYDTDISRGLTEKIKHSDGFKDKVTEWSMKGAELADKVTFGTLWVACDFEIRETRKDLKVGSEEFKRAVADRLRDVVYATQVVDSTMTRSDMMRSSDGRDKMFTTFGSEPIIAYNMLLDAFTTYNRDKKTLGKKEARKKNGKKIRKVITAYAITNMVAALVETAFDAFRDEDNEEMEASDFVKLYFKNFLLDMSIGNKLPYIKELYSILQGYSSSRMDTQWMVSLVNSWDYIKKIGEGDPDWDKTIKQILKLTSQLTGVSVYNPYRDGKALIDLFLEDED